MSAASPIDVVLGNPSQAPKRRRGLRVAAWAVALAIHAAVVIAAQRSGPSLEVWSAELALEVHEALVDDQVIELATPPRPEPSPPPVTPVVRRAAPPSATQPPATAPMPSLASSPPTEAAAVVTQDDAPIDLTGTTVVTGTGATALGGAVSATGTDTAEAPLALPNLAPVPQSASAPSLARPVQLDASRWRCAWPDDAISQDIYEQAVVLRVVVLADGSVEAAQLIDDPGHGFGRAALVCAKRTRFTPALDASGHPVRALSPPIRVRFTR